LGQEHCVGTADALQPQDFVTLDSANVGAVLGESFARANIFAQYMAMRGSSGGRGI